MCKGPEDILTHHQWSQKAQLWLQDAGLFMKPSNLVHFQISFLESHTTSEQQEMMPELLLQRADNKTKIKNSHPQTSQTPHTSNCKQTLRPGKSFQRDTGTRQHPAAGSAPRTRQGSTGSSVHTGVSSKEKLFFFFCNIRIS